jgi:hypothetical protein
MITEESIDLKPQPLKGAESKFGGGNQEAAALRALVGQMNTPMAVGSDANPLKRTTIPSEVQAEVDAALRGGPLAAPTPAPATEVVPTAVDFSRVFFTGRMFAGKDHCADAAGYTKVGIPDPMYELVSDLTGVKITSTEGKDVPGIRALLQAVGQYGRGTVSAQYPWTMSRVMFLQFIEKTYPVLYGKGYGKTDSFWIDRFFESIGDTPRLACTNVRFKNEFDGLRAGGFEHWHVMTSPAEWNARLADKGMTPQSKELNDVSEEFAKAIDRDVSTKLTQPGGKIRCIWNSKSPSPSRRMYSVSEFVSRVSTTTASPVQADVFTGE